jgi:site-specific recombinase XerD
MEGENSYQKGWNGQMPRKGGLLDEYIESLAGRADSTVETYRRELGQLLTWISERPGNTRRFCADQLTVTALESYLTQLGTEGHSISHRARVKSAVGGFARWLIEEKNLLRRNPARRVVLPAQPLLAPRELIPDQRYVLRSLVERQDDFRSEALFALGYWAGCRVSDVSWLRVEHVHLGPKVGWIHVGYKGGKQRDLDVVNPVRKPLYDYMQRGGRDPDSPYAFTSQRAERLTEAGIHHWFRSLKAQANQKEWELIHDITYHDLRHDWAHRARQSGWDLEEVAYYLGHVTKKGTPAIQTTARYTQVSRETVKKKLRLLS